MSNNKNAYGSRKRPLSETINNLKSWYRKVRYLIVDAPSYCKDLFSLKCNQLTMRDCAIKNFAIQYIDINSRNAEKIANDAAEDGDLESRKQFLVQKKGMSEDEIAEAWHRHPTLMRKDKND